MLLQHTARLRCGNQRIRIFRQQKLLLDRIGRGLFDGRNVARMIGIPLLQ